MNTSQSPSSTTTRRRELQLLLVLLAILFLAVGPGVLLVNRPEPILGLPAIYFWGILWYLGLGGLAILMNRLVWRHQLKGPEPEDRDAS